MFYNTKMKIKKSAGFTFNDRFISIGDCENAQKQFCFVMQM